MKAFNLKKTCMIVLPLLILMHNGCKKESAPAENKLPVVETLALTEICPESALGGGNIISDNNDKIIRKGVVWNTIEFPTIDEFAGKTEEGEWAGLFLSHLTGLQPDVTYFVRAFAANSYGISYGDQITFTTLKANTAADIHGNIYPTAKIGNQEWFAANLRVTSFADGTPIRGDLDAYEWYSSMTPGYRIYPHAQVDGINSDDQMSSIYGLLYNWYAAGNERGLCPKAGGWRVATYEDWNKLIEHVNGVCPENIADKLKSCRQDGSPVGGGCDTDQQPRWSSDHFHHGTDDFGFAALPAGSLSWTGPFWELGQTGAWWCYDMNPQSGNIWFAFMKNEWGDLFLYHSYRSNGFSVRCVRDR